MSRHSAWVLAIALWAGSAEAAEVLSVDVAKEDGRFHMSFEAAINAPADRVLALLTDYPGLPRLNPEILEVKMLPPSSDGAKRMSVITRPCVLFFCRTIHHVQEVRKLGPGDMLANVIPEVSDFTYGYMRWRIVEHGEGTLLKFTGTVAPGFWVPPLIGALLVRLTLQDEALAVATNVERLAKEQ